MSHILSRIYRSLALFLFTFSCLSAQSSEKEPSLINPLYDFSKEESLETKKMIEEGKRCFAAKNHKKALLLFQKSLIKDPQNIELNYLIGQSAYHIQDFEESLFAYKRVLLMEPNHLLAKVEKARTHLALQSFNEAQDELAQILEMDISPHIRKSAEKLLDQLIQRRHKSFHGFFQVGYTIDSNVTLGTKSVALPTINQISLVSDPTKRSDHVRFLILSLNHSKPLNQDKWEWKSRFLGYLADNEKVNSNDFHMGGVTSGIAFKENKQTLELSLGLDFLFLNDELYQSNKKVLLDYQRGQMRSFYHFTKRHHFSTGSTGIKNLSGFVHAFGLNYLFKKDVKNQFLATFQSTFDRSPSDTAKALSYWRFLTKLLYRHFFTETVDLSFETGYRKDLYQQTHSVFTDRKRDDNGWVNQLTLQKKALKKGYVQLSLFYIDNHSNISTNAYETKRATLSLTYPF